MIDTSMTNNPEMFLSQNNVKFYHDNGFRLRPF